MEPVYRCIAGIDVHKKLLAVGIRRPSGEATEYMKRKFGTMKNEIIHLSAWLKEHGVTEVVMESTAHIGGRYGMAWSHISSSTSRIR